MDATMKIGLLQYVIAPLIVALLAWLNRRNAIPAFAREYVAKIGEDKLVKFAMDADSFVSLNSQERAAWVKAKISDEIAEKPDGYDGIANFLVEYAYQLYKTKKGW